MKQNTLILIALALMTLLSGCREDSFFLDSENNGPMPENLYEITVSGFVTDEDSNPISGAEVSLVTDMAVTNEMGYFEVTGLADEQLALVTVSKPGFFKGFRTLVPSQSKTAKNRTRIQLIKRIATTSFESSSGGSATIGDKSKVTFQANSIIDSQGNAYDGPVLVYSHYIDPTDADIDQYMPGNMMARDSQEEMAILQSFGMINVELQSVTGEELNIDQPATIEVEVPPSLLSNAPATIPLWYFDESDGLWKEEGSASLNGGVYQGEVNHFTPWNCDVAEVVTFIEGQVVDGRGVSFVKIRVTDLATGAVYNAWIDTDGFFAGVVPQDTELLFEILGFCGDDDVLFSSTIGPFAEDLVNLGVFDITNNNDLTFFSGLLVDCSQVPLTSGEVYFNLPSLGYYQQVSIDDDGTFNALIPSCGMAEILVRGMNLANGLVSETISVIPDGQSVVLETIEVCIDVSPSLGSIEMNLFDLGVFAEQKLFDNCTVSINPNNNLGQTSYVFRYYELLPPVNDTITYFWLLEDANNDINNPNWVSASLFYSPPASAENSVYNKYTPGSIPFPTITVDQVANTTGELMIISFDNITIGRRTNNPDGLNDYTSFAGSNITITAVRDQ